MKALIGLASSITGAAVVLGATAAMAQSAEGFTLDTLRPSERGRDWFVADSLDLRGSARPALGALGNWSHEPLVVYDAESGDELGAIVNNQWIVHAYGSVTLANRLRLSLSLPVLLHQDGDAVVIGGDRVEAKSDLAIGDLRVGALLGLVGSYDDPISLALGVQAKLPTGQQDSFTGDGSVSVVPRAIAAGKIAIFVYSAEVGLRVGKSRSGWFNETTGEQMQVAAAAGLRPIPNLTFGPEIWGTTTVGSSRFLKRTATPLELLLGGHYRVGDVSFGAGVGFGLTRGYGAPIVRTLLGLEWSPEPEAEASPAPAAPPPAPVVADRDRDGVPDAEDACPDRPGVVTNDPKTNGCPSDRDGDGVIDIEDACPEVRGVATEDPKTNGCPPDRDGDRIVDASDACPDEPGVPNQDPDKNGCPAPKDRDGDSILDVEDACPDQPGPRTEQPQTNGCPMARVDSAQIVILEAVRFAYNSDRILPESEPVLKAVYDVISSHPEIEALEVHGHTDDRGAAAYNLKLSERRAASVAKWLVAKGLDASRIASFGFGKTRPILPNDSDQNRERNRRVEFHIVPKKGGPR